MAQKGPELKSSILGGLTSNLRVTRGNRPRGVHLWHLFSLRVTFTVHVRDVFCVYYVCFLLPYLINIFHSCSTLFSMPKNTLSYSNSLFFFFLDIFCMMVVACIFRHCKCTRFNLQHNTKPIQELQHIFKYIHDYKWNTFYYFVSYVVFTNFVTQ